MEKLASSSHNKLDAQQDEINHKASGRDVRTGQSRFWHICIDLLLLLAMSACLAYGTFWKYPNIQAASVSDPGRYQCYAVAFWQGTAALKTLPQEQCSFMPSVPSYGPLHALPGEYPLLNLVPFSLPMAAGPFYPMAFALMMLVITGITFFLLKSFSTPGAGYALVVYLLVGSGLGVTVLGRFDLIPSLLTLLALICAERARWKTAYLLLALATMSKFYPVVLLPLFFIAQIAHNKPFSRQNLVSLGIFAGTCALAGMLSLLLNVDGTLAPLHYFFSRPIQIESFPASVLWLISVIGKLPLTFAFSFGSRNIFSPLSPIVSGGSTLLLGVGLLSVYWLLWRKKIALSMAFLLGLLVMVLTGKVFSAQYLIWLIPLVAYIGKWNWKWLLAWNSVCLVTTLIYPFLYDRTHFSFGPLLPDMYPTVLVRNILLLGFTCLLFYRAISYRSQVDAS